MTLIDACRNALADHEAGAVWQASPAANREIMATAPAGAVRGSLAVDVPACLFGLSIKIDASVPDHELQLRDEAGRVLARIDLRQL